MIGSLIQRGALFVINHSGGKDSQAMTIKLLRIVPASQLIVIHAHLPGVEWEGTTNHIATTIGDLPLTIVQARKTFMEMVEHRQMWPSPSTRQCTSDLKRGPIEKAIRHELKRRELKLVVNCMGMRAQESSARAKKEVLKFNARNSKAGREWYDWLPIHSMTESEVFRSIKLAGQNPHWAYGEGMSRLSCCFCIMSSQSDLRIAAKLNPELYQQYVETEQRINHTLSMARIPLSEIIGSNKIPSPPRGNELAQYRGAKTQRLSNDAANAGRIT